MQPDRTDQEPTAKNWWKLNSKADLYTMAGANAILATLFILNPQTHVAPGWRIALVAVLLASSARFVWTAWRLPPKLRFSLRTLLIATTLIAMVLGIIAWMSR